MTAQNHITEQRDTKSTSWRYSLIAAGIPADTVDSFLIYHKNNPAIWLHFESFANHAAMRGKKIGAKAIFERVRWEVEINEGHDFKVNNNYAAYYARAFEIKHPGHKGFFEFRTVTGLKDAA